jgi:hypothetical protein
VNRIILFASLVLIATLTHGAALESESLAQFRMPRVPVETYQKVAHGGPLKLNDVVILSRAGVSHAEIISYLYTYGERFRLSPAQVADLRQQGVTSDILDYLISPPAQPPRLGF